jgi:hypothetical protein
LARLKGGCVLSGRILEVHPEPNRPNDKPDDASRDVLSNFSSLLVCELGGFGVVGFDFCPDHCAVGIGVLWLHACDRLRVSTGARRQCEPNGHWPVELGPRTRSEPHAMTPRTN